MLPLGQTADVYVPPQPRKKGKAGQDEAQREGPPATLELIPDARHSCLDELVRTYSDRLRIAVDSETCFVTITGSHARVGLIHSQDTSILIPRF